MTGSDHLLFHQEIVGTVVRWTLRDAVDESDLTVIQWRYRYHWD